MANHCCATWNLWLFRGHRSHVRHSTFTSLNVLRQYFSWIFLKCNVLYHDNINVWNRLADCIGDSTILWWKDGFTSRSLLCICVCVLLYYYRWEYKNDSHFNFIPLKFIPYFSNVYVCLSALFSHLVYIKITLYIAF